MIDTVSLDAGGVLVFPNWERISSTFAQHGVSVTAEALQAADAGARFAIDEADRVATTSDADRGSEYFRLVFAKAGVPPDLPIQPLLADLWAYHTAHNLWEHVPPDVVPALERLTALGVRLAVASNANGSLHRLFDRVGLTRHFHTICDSWIEGVEKPDPRFFRLILDRCGGRPESTVHVGDLYHVDVLGARAAGLHAVLMDPHGLYADYAVGRIRSLDELVDLVAAQRAGGVTPA